MSHLLMPASYLEAFALQCSINQRCTDPETARALAALKDLGGEKAPLEAPPQPRDTARPVITLGVPGSMVMNESGVRHGAAGLPHTVSHGAACQQLSCSTVTALLHRTLRNHFCEVCAHPSTACSGR